MFIGYASHANGREKELAVNSFATRRVMFGPLETAGFVSTVWPTTQD